MDRELSKKRNRDHARQTRKRKKQWIASLQQRLRTLSEEERIRQQEESKQFAAIEQQRCTCLQILKAYLAWRSGHGLGTQSGVTHSSGSPFPQSV